MLGLQGVVECRELVGEDGLVGFRGGRGLGGWVLGFCVKQTKHQVKYA